MEARRTDPPQRQQIGALVCPRQRAAWDEWRVRRTDGDPGEPAHRRLRQPSQRRERPPQGWEPRPLPLQLVTLIQLKQWQRQLKVALDELQPEMASASQRRRVAVPQQREDPAPSSASNQPQLEQMSQRMVALCVQEVAQRRPQRPGVLRAHMQLPLHPTRPRAIRPTAAARR